jgi:leucyl aminopeptidase
VEDTLNDGLAEALRPLCKKPVSETLILDASLEESSGALTKRCANCLTSTGSLMIWACIR